jgi:hypothetical protein
MLNTLQRKIRKENPFGSPRQQFNEKVLIKVSSLTAVLGSDMDRAILGDKVTEDITVLKTKIHKKLDWILWVLDQGLTTEIITK